MPMTNTLSLSIAQWPGLRPRYRRARSSEEGRTREDMSIPMPQPQVVREALQSLAEDALLRRARAGDREAFGEIVRRYQDAVFNLCYRMLGDFHEAEDAAQETFLKAFRHLHRYDPGRRFSTWILSIASHHCIDRLRTRRVNLVSLDAPDVHQHRGRTSHPEEAVLRQEQAERVQAMLQRLPVDYRAVLVLHYWYDMSYREIADVLGTTEGAVKTRAHRARRELGKMLREEGEGR